MSSSTPVMKKFVCDKCKVGCYHNGNSNNFRCPRCRFIDSLPVIRSSSKEEACSICLVDLNSKETTSIINELPCRHQFHKKCISEWIGRSKSSCPLCRHKLPIDDTSTSTSMYYSDTITRPRDDGVTPARYLLHNGERIYLMPSDNTMILLVLSDDRSYYVPWPPRRRQVVATTTNNNISGGGRTTTTASHHNNRETTILQDEDGDTLMQDEDGDTLMQDEDGDTLMLDA